MGADMLRVKQLAGHMKMRGRYFSKIYC